MATSLTFTGDSNDAQAAIAKLERKYADMENRIKQGGKAAKDSGDAGLAAFARFGSTITGVASGMDLVTKSIELAKTAFGDFLDMQERAKKTNVDFGKVAAEMALNLGAGDDPSKKIGELLELSRRTQVAPSDLAKIMNTAQAAKGPLSDKQVESTVEDVSRIARLSPEAMQPIVGASLDLQRHLPGTKSKDAIGFILNSAAESHVAEVKDYATNLIPAISAIAADDGTGPEYAAAVANAMTKVSDDPTGKRTATGLLAHHYQLKRALPHLKGFKERMEFAQENPDFAKAFFEGGQFQGKDLPAQDMEVVGPGGEEFSFKGKTASYEKRTKPSVEQVTKKGTTGFDEMQGILKKVPSLDMSEADYAAKVKGIEDDPNLQVAHTANRVKVAAELARLGNTQGAKDSIARTDVDDLLKDKGVDYFSRQQIGWKASMKWGKTREEAMKDVLQQEATDFRKREQKLPGEAGKAAGEQASRYESVLGTMNGEGGNEVAEALKKNNELLQQNNELLGRQNANPRNGRTLNRGGNTEPKQ